MGIFMQILAAAIFGWLSYRIYKQLRANPQLFTKEALQQSFWTMGVLGLALVLFVAFLVVMLRP